MQEKEIQQPIEVAKEDPQKAKEKKPGGGFVVAQVLMMVLTLFMLGLTVFCALFPALIALGGIFFLFLVLILDVILVIGTIFLILLADGFWEMNRNAFAIAEKSSELTNVLVNISHIVVPITLGLAAICYLSTWIINIVALAKTKRKFFKVTLVLLIIATSVFVILAIAALILNFIPRN